MAGEADGVAVPVVAFETQEDWEAWLEEHQGDVDGVWLRIPKKGSGIAGVDYATALESALCHGWIDGHKKGLDDTHWLQRFTSAAGAQPVVGGQPAKGPRSHRTRAHAAVRAARGGAGAGGRPLGGRVREPEHGDRPRRPAGGAGRGARGR
ncbi:hypothetical protein GCM10023238_06930 [Streptomyces heliomycini]